MHAAGSQNTAADFLSRQELTRKEEVQLKIRNDILTAPIVVNLQSTDVADEEQRFFLPEEGEESEQETFARKARSKQREKEPSTKVAEVIKIPLNSAVYTFGAVKESARIRDEQDAHPLLKAIKLRVPRKEYDKNLKTEPRLRILLRHEERVVMKDGVLIRKNYGEEGRSSPGHNIETSSPKIAIHPSWQDKQTPRNHEADTRMQNKVLFPGISTENQSLVTSCPDCISNKRIHTRQIRSKIGAKQFSLWGQNVV